MARRRRAARPTAWLLLTALLSIGQVFRVVGSNGRQIVTARRLQDTRTKPPSAPSTPPPAPGTRPAPAPGSRAPDDLSVSELLLRYDEDRSGTLDRAELAELVHNTGASQSIQLAPTPRTRLPGGTVGYLQTPGGYPSGPAAVDVPWVVDFASHPLTVGFTLIWALVLAIIMIQAGRKAHQAATEAAGRPAQQLAPLSNEDTKLVLVLTGAGSLFWLGVCEYFFTTRQESFALLDLQFMCMWICVLGAVLISVGRRVFATQRHEQPDATDTANVLDQSAASDDVEDGVPASNGRKMKALGYRTSPAGAAARSAMMCGCVLWMLLCFAVLYDYYNACQLTGVDNLCFYGDYAIFGGWVTNSELLFQSWWLMLLWFVPLISMQNRIGRFFKDRCSLREAEHVWVWVPNVDEGEKNVVSPTVVVLMVRRLRRLLGRFSSTTGGHDAMVAVQTNSRRRKFFIFECTRYMIDPSADRYDVASVKCSNTHSQILSSVNGLSSAEHVERLDAGGENIIPFDVDSWSEAAAAEFLSMFYLYQLLIYYVWFWFSYLIVAAFLGCIVVGSGLLNVYISRLNQMTIAQLTAYSTECTVIRNQQESVCRSDQLVPGDVVIIKGEGWTLPCDLCLVVGSAVCDESGLTGESMPVRKIAIPAPETDNDPLYDPEHRDAKHTLFAGTKVLQSGTSSSDRVLAVVTATGISTSKGQLVSSILFPGVMRFKYDEELPAVMMILGFICMCIFNLSGYLQEISGQPKTGITAWAYGIFTVSQTLSPLLPLALVVGQTVSSARLKEIGVRCINPKRIAISAKVRCFCFDKTGTLTKDGLDFLGAQPVLRGLHGSTSLFGTFSNLLLPGGDNTNPDTTSRALAEVLEVNDADPLLLIGLATCHALTMLSTTESKRLVGNEVEVKMFTATKFELFEELGQSPVVRSPMGSVLRLDKRFEFDHGTMTMSVIITDEQSGESYVFCKGAPERLCERCEPESVPPDYLSVQAAHATAGCYVLAMGVRRLGKIDHAVIAQMSRRDAEVGLQLLGLILFRNELKADSRQAILDLKRGDVRCVMITGDNAQCGIHIAGESGMLSPDASVALGDVDQQGEVVWSIVKGDEHLNEHDRTVLKTASRSSLTNAQVLQLSSELAVTGKAFDALCNTAVNNPVTNGNTTYAELLLLRTRIFARVSPSCKELIVRMHIAKGLIVGMCGDGGNDCGALRAAHVGVALSEAEASVVSPFTAATKSVRSVVDLLREGRCALATSFAGYKFLITYGQIFPVVKLWCFYYGVIMPMADYLMIDVVIVTVVSWALTRAEPLPELGPFRPTSSLLGPTTIASVVGLTMLNAFTIYLALSMVSSHENYVKFPATMAHGADWWTLGDTWESTTLFACFSCQFVTSALNFGLGSKYRQPLTGNTALLCTCATLYALFSYILLADPDGVVALFHIASIEYNSVETESPVWLNYQAACAACLNATQCWAYPVGELRNEHLCGTLRDIIEVTMHQDTRVVCGTPPDRCSPTIDGQGIISVDPNCCTSQGMPYELRRNLWLLIVANSAAAFSWEAIGVQGPLRDFLRRKFPADSGKGAAFVL